VRQTIIPGTSLRTSRFILGTASLFTGQSEAQAERFLERAVELGFTHFDTAPLYGFGFAERALALVLRRHKQLTVTTKAGLYSPGGEDQGRQQIFLRKVVGRAFPVVSRAKADLAVSRARASLTASLARLGRDHIELFVVHEPNAMLLGTDEWLSWLSGEQKAGRIGNFGVAGTKERVGPFLTSKSALAAVVQMSDSLTHREADILAERERPMQITYGYMSSKSAGASAPETLVAALQRNLHGAIVTSTRRIERLPQYGDAVVIADKLVDEI